MPRASPSAQAPEFTDGAAFPHGRRARLLRVSDMISEEQAATERADGSLQGPERGGGCSTVWCQMASFMTHEVSIH